MVFNIDLDRGVHSRSDPSTGMEVYMYVDEPGIFRSAHGTEVSVDLARRAGFPIDELMQKRKRNEALKAAHDKVLAELDEADHGARVITKEKDGFKIVDIGYDRYQVLSPEGDLLNPAPLNLRSATILLDELAPDPAPAVLPSTPAQV